MCSCNKEKDLSRLTPAEFYSGILNFCIEENKRGLVYDFNEERKASVVISEEAGDTILVVSCDMEGGLLINSKIYKNGEIVIVSDGKIISKSTKDYYEKKIASLLKHLYRDTVRSQ